MLTSLFREGKKKRRRQEKQKKEKAALHEPLKAEVHPEREPRGDISPILDQPVMASLYILILMTPAAKPALSLKQVPLPHSSLKTQDHSTSTTTGQQRLQMKRMKAKRRKKT